MKKRLLLLSFIISMATVSRAQWSAGALVGLGHLYQRQVSESSEYVSIAAVEPLQPLILAGGYGQFATKGKWAMLAGLQLRYQHQSQTRGPYDYLVVTPYVGTRLFKKLEITVGPELSTLLHTGFASMGGGAIHNPTKLVMGYNLKATYWFGRLGLEGGYSHQNTAFNREEHPITTTFSFYNRYLYGALKYRLTQ